MGGRPLTDKFPPEQLAKMRPRLLAFAEGMGVTGMRMNDWSPNTRRVLAMAEYAREEGKLDAFRTGAMEAYWREGKNLEDDTVLRELAQAAGLDADAALAAGHDPKYLDIIDHTRFEANAMGVTAIPTFIMGNQGVVGCQPYDVLAEVVEAVYGAKQ